MARSAVAPPPDDRGMRQGAAWRDGAGGIAIAERIDRGADFGVALRFRREAQPKPNVFERVVGVGEAEAALDGHKGELCGDSKLKEYIQAFERAGQLMAHLAAKAFPERANE